MAKSRHDCQRFPTDGGSTCGSMRGMSSNNNVNQRSRQAASPCAAYRFASAEERATHNALRQLPRHRQRQYIIAQLPCSIARTP